MNVRALNRALLARQHLLERTSQPVATMLGNLVGMQAQAPLAPYVGLWTRISGFRPEELAALITGRAAVRGSLMRGTVHLVLAEDARILRPLIQPVVASGYTGHFGRRIGDADLGAVAAAGRAWLEERPRTRRQLRELLTERWPDHDAEALSYAVGYFVPTAQLPPRGVWGSTGPAVLTTLDGWTPPAPARFLPEYDNVLLSHADRTRVLPPGRRVPLPPGNGASRGTLLVDGFYRADWRLHGTSLEITPLDRLTAGERAEIEEEAARLLEFLGAGERSVRITGD
ncbi:hypothetical protein AMES_4261 [Amycolatopsis mediterranei S699]|uniref:Winged helix DNA-binding domain-containing protein n=2 Tax=Amycolatopsis mediterranei TaxID=33910 RepID=A0A0H3D638_AMYMU|nr:crosslink repair DNA glycosylase YcaQ family protein [Amycolatopsis mediterranei]ADJ46086.1 conserved hypothetical protein [Amycolatopsis mediterranei U32]AEK42872.1 hypothetical protein RAM_21960 [Amycolatopsis mediterranei S699]AFO77797.1 hypothetical protein AMES_4261 [Amycolatopsis mediterranei S699]AGT84925.1 hypothetical protein B737_4261 [Amycolatopsis mediterranei RB]KDO05621.1 hypothetical protein DV26_38965 [Amycolatopsis mediterranei]